MAMVINGRYALINGRLKVGTVEITNYSIKNEDLADDAVDERVIKDNIDLSTIGVIAKTKTSLITPDADLNLSGFKLLDVGGLTIGPDTATRTIAFQRNSGGDVADIGYLNFIDTYDDQKYQIKTLRGSDGKLSLKFMYYDGSSWYTRFTLDHLGNLDVASLKIGGTTVIDSSKNLVGVNAFAQDLYPDGDGTRRIGHWGNNLRLYSIATMRVRTAFINPDIDQDISVFTNSPNAPSRVFTFDTIPADDTNTLRDSPALQFRGRYWDGSQDQSLYARIQLIMLDTSPTAKLSIKFAGNEKVYIKSDGTLNIVGDFQIGDTTVIDSSRNLVGVSSLAQDLLPDADNTRSIGSSSARLANVYAVNVVTGDIVFQERKCAICGREFKEGDIVVLKVTKVDEKGTHCVPVHLSCTQE